VRNQVFCFLLSAIAQFCASGPIRPAYAEPSIKSPESLPLRKSGLWRISTLSPAVGLQVGEACVGPNDSIIGDADTGCAKPGVTRAGEQIVVTVVCAADGRRVTSSLLLTGDFTTWYRAQGKITSAGEDPSADVHSGFTIDAKYLRPDCAESASPK